MTKGDLVVELGDESCTVGVYTGAKYKKKLGIRWHRKCFRWVRRSQLRLANEQEVVRYNSLPGPFDFSHVTSEQFASALLILFAITGCDLMTGPKYVYSPPCPIITDTVWSSGQIVGIIHTQVGTGYCIIK